MAADLGASTFHRVPTALSYSVLRAIESSSMEPDIERLDAAKPQRMTEVQVFVEHLGFVAAQQLRKEFPQLHLREQVSDAVMHARTEGQILILRAGHIDFLRVRKCPRITVRAGHHEKHELSFFQLMAVPDEIRRH